MVGNEIFVKNLDFSVTEEDLREFFKCVGPVRSVKVLIDKQTGKSKGRGFVAFATATEAARAIENMNGGKLKGRAVVVEWPKSNGVPAHTHPDQPPDPKPHSDPAANQDPNGAGEQSTPSLPDCFYNPYTFVPTPIRRGIPDDNFAGDQNPLTNGLVHNRLQPDRWTGVITVKAEIMTPLILCAHKPENPDAKHKIYKCRSLPEASELRGMLRSAFETITNSRYHGFDKGQHSARLGLRKQARAAIPLVPGRVTGTGKERKLELLCGKSQIDGENGPAAARGQTRLMYAAWLPRYRKYNPKKTKFFKFLSLSNTGVHSFTLPSRANVNHYRPGTAIWATAPALPQEFGMEYRFGDISLTPNAGKIKGEIVESPPEDKHESTDALPYSFAGGTPAKPYNSSDLPRHLDEVAIEVSGPKPHWSRGFRYLEVTDIVKRVPGSPLPADRIAGYACITGRNIANRHYERIFFCDGTPEPADFQPGVVERYNELVANYREIHRGERAETEMNAYLGHDPGQTGFSRHVWNRGDDKLKSGDLVFAKVKKIVENGGRWEVEALYPVMISRELYDCSPGALLDPSLQHAETICDLSPADRLFGWVAGGEQKGAYKGRLRVVVGRDGEPSPDEFDTPLTLPILDRPKPEQGRFYVAKDESGSFQDPGGDKKSRGYDQFEIDGRKKALRGRKHYWHHKGLEREEAKEYWNPNASEPQTLAGVTRYPEYRQHVLNNNRELDQGKQNRSITGWIKPGEQFTFDLHLINAVPEEIGALLWLLDLPEGHFFRLGYGKPLGLGSLKLSCQSKTLAKGEKWKTDYYGDLFHSAFPDEMDGNTSKECMDAFMKAMLQAYSKIPHQTDSAAKPPTKDAGLSPDPLATQVEGPSAAGGTPLQTAAGLTEEDKERFFQLPFIEGFLRVCHGPAKPYPVHYPRRDPKPDSNGENFKWFMANEEGTRHPDKTGLHLCLPSVLDDDGSLPYKPLK
jgi:CRISPR-associated protein (TIGR03986 family)